MILHYLDQCFRVCGNRFILRLSNAAKTSGSIDRLSVLSLIYAMVDFDDSEEAWQYYDSDNMFNKQPQEPKEGEKINLDFSDLIVSPAKNDMTETQQEENDWAINDPNEEKSIAVSNVEKISTIFSPYFLVIVGLTLYENNFLIGTLLIILGILSLLKVSYRDVGEFLQWLKKLFGLN
jgi:hypothetical protein